MNSWRGKTDCEKRRFIVSLEIFREKPERNLKKGDYTPVVILTQSRLNTEMMTHFFQNVTLLVKIHICVFLGRKPTKNGVIIHEPQETKNRL